MSKQVGRISGHVLQDNLLTNRTVQTFGNTSGDTATLYLDIANRRIGVNNEAPTRDLTIPTYMKSAGINADRVELPIFTIDDDITANVGSIFLNANEKIQLSALQTAKLKIDNNTIYTLENNDNIDLIPSGTGTVEVQKSVNIYGNLNATGNISHAGSLIFGDGPETPDTVIFDTTVNSNLVPDSGEFNLGSPEKRWKDLFSNYLNGRAIGTGELSVGTNNPALRQGNIYYVAANGEDTNVGDHPMGAFASLKHALSVADVSTIPVTIKILPGVYQEELPLYVPENVTIVGTDIRTCIIEPATSTQSQDVFHLNGQSGVENLTIRNFYYNAVNNTGYAFRFAPGAIVSSRSPYIRNCTVITQGTAITEDDPRGFASGDAGRGAECNGIRLDPLAANVHPSMLFHSVTFITPGSIGLLIKNDCRVEWLNSFTYFASIGIKLENGPGRTVPGGGAGYGGELRAIGSANVYGNYGIIADGVFCLAYLIGHNFAYIGTGKDVTNDSTKVIEEQKWLELNNGKVYVTSTTQSGEFSVGDEFFVDFETGTTSIGDDAINYEGLTELVINTNNQQTILNAEFIRTGNIRFRGNTIESTAGNINIVSATGETNFNTSVSMKKDVDITGSVSIGGQLIRLGDQPTDIIKLNVEIDQDLYPEITSTHSLGSSLKRWERVWVNQANVDSITIKNNFITTNESNANLEFISNSAGYVDLENIRFKDNELSTRIEDLNLNVAGSLDLTSNTSFVLSKGNSAQRTLGQGDLRFHNVDNVFEGYGDAVISFRGVYSADRRTSLIAHKTANTLDMRVNNVSVGQVNSTGLQIHGLQGDSVRFNDSRITTVDSNADLHVLRNGTGRVLIDGAEYFRNSNFPNYDANGPLNLYSTSRGFIKVGGTFGAALPSIGTFEYEDMDLLPLGQSMTGATVWTTVTGGTEIVASGSGSGQTGGFDSLSEGFNQYARFTGNNTRALVSKVYNFTNLIGGRVEGKVIAGNDFNGGEIPSGSQDILLQWSHNGVDWNTIAEIAGARNFSAFSIWTDFEITITPDINSATTQLRIVQADSNGGTLDNWGVVDVSVRYSIEESVNPEIGSIRYNIGTKQQEVYSGVAWIPATGVEEDPVTEDYMNDLTNEWSLILG